MNFLDSFYKTKQTVTEQRVEIMVKALPSEGLFCFLKPMQEHLLSLTINICYVYDNDYIYKL